MSTNEYQTLNRIEISRSNILSNVALIQKQHPKFKVIPVLKSNAYGHGLKQVAEILNEADCAFVAVDGYFEAAQIRNLTKHPILVLGYIRPENVKLLDTKKCSFVVQDIRGLQAFGELGKPVRIHLELNTGMNRLGLSEGELLDYLEELRRHRQITLEGIMSHLADADNGQNDSWTHDQVKQFDRMVKAIKKAGFSPRYIHIAQTAGSTKVKSVYANSIRLGVGLYGINPLNESDAHFRDLQKLQPVLELKSTVIKIVDLKKGDKVSYNGIFTAPQNMRVGILPLGYYEGVPRELSNKGVVAYENKAFPIVGRVCMNHTMVNLKDVDIRVGDEVTIISSDPTSGNSVQAICQSHDIFNYLFVTKLSSSIKRVIV